MNVNTYNPLTAMYQICEYCSCAGTPTPKGHCPSCGAPVIPKEHEPEYWRPGGIIHTGAGAIYTLGSTYFDPRWDTSTR